MAAITQVSRVILKKVLAVETPEVCPYYCSNCAQSTLAGRLVMTFRV
jgi:hypothetical protein